MDDTYLRCYFYPELIIMAEGDATRGEEQPVESDAMMILLE